jgi:hypothetical protein
MDNHTRRVSYVTQNRHCPREQAEEIVTASYADGTTTGLLTPPQRRRISRSGTKGFTTTGGTHFRRQRAARAARLARRQALLGAPE